MDDERLLTVQEVAARVRTTAATVRRWLRQGKLRGVMPGGTKLGYRIPSSELRRFISQRTTGDEFGGKG